MATNNNDNAMTRFLFAILKQKNLKDINWDQVAHDPVLGEGKKITNGHAARMRYSRFRSSMLGLEPTRRNRTGQPKSRVTKSKKEPRLRKGENVKSELALDSPELHDSIETTPPRIKQESPYPSFESRLTPRLTPGPGSMPPPMHNTSGVIQPRLLTPCSDMDMFSPSPTLMSSPGTDLIPRNSFEFRESPCPNHNDPMWPSVPSYPAYSPSYPFEDYGAGHCEHPHMHPQQVHLGLPSQPIDPNEEWVNVKREASWDDF
ncbi:uncharacterized protein GGS22DRAFT_146626 [Annulohypoxylon maeteangense]|uniref:uncharacterized protein n=1 Tax=Annulohypoxylon maeteangense TaxID=1927788 RepID=UPI00200751B6|nr:uncharacterized protein GGS22DRAFT_146626 [Annulohypoxylon maeteangense]KAI0884755.1 hypothetical protein GGS22DRAFT_146626 [Annulohypoxylon maeteangense]